MTALEALAALAATLRESGVAEYTGEVPGAPLLMTVTLKLGAAPARAADEPSPPPKRDLTPDQRMDELERRLFPERLYADG